MPLIVVNPSPFPKRKAKAKRNPSTPARKPAAKKGTTMAKHARSAAQKAATRRMLAANQHRNPSPRRKATKRRTLRRNPSPMRYARRRRNPSSTGGGGSLFSRLLSKEGLMMMGAVVITPTLTELLVGYVMPTSTGYTRIAVKGMAGLALGYAAYKWLNKQVGLTISLVAAGTAGAEAIHQYQAGATQSGYAPRKELSGYGPVAQLGNNQDRGNVFLG
jgi:hypothetical protein